MFRARLTALALSAGLVLVSGCGLMGGGSGSGLLGGGFGHNCCKRQTDCGCEQGMLTYSGPNVIPTGEQQFPMPAPMPPSMNTPGLGNPPRIQPIPQAAPMPYTP